MPDATLEITPEVPTSDRSTLVLHAAGPLDATTAAVLARALWRLDPRVRHVILDLAAVTLIDSPGIQALMSAHVHGERAGYRFSLSGATGQVAEVLTITGVAEHLARTPDEEL